MFYCICCRCVHATSDLPLRESRQRRSGNERCYGAYAHGVARSHCRVLYHIRHDEITVATRSRSRLSPCARQARRRHPIPRSQRGSCSSRRLVPPEQASQTPSSLITLIVPYCLLTCQIGPLPLFFGRCTASYNRPFAHGKRVGDCPSHVSKAP